MSKQALCIKREDFMQFYQQGREMANDTSDISNFNSITVLHPKIIELFDQLPATLLPRAECETDPSYLQLIPYIVIINKDQQILSYRRGSGGDEDRLHQKYSIGFGGHIEEESEGSLLEVIVYTAAKELHEELGLLLDEKTQANLLNVLKSGLLFIYDDSDAVNRVHLGIGIVLQVDQINLESPEAHTIQSLKFYDLQSLLQSECFTDGQLENWSQIALATFAELYTE